MWIVDPLASANDVLVLYMAFVNSDKNYVNIYGISEYVNVFYFAHILFWHFWKSFVTAFSCNLKAEAKPCIYSFSLLA